MGNESTGIESRVDDSVSAIIPTFNRAATLRRALASVFGQTQPPREVIVIDDGSEDETEQMVAAEFPEVIYRRQANRGVSSARNHGIRISRGRWLAFLDSDDQWLPRKLETQLTAFAADPAMAICHTEELWIRNGRRVNPKAKHAKGGGWIFRRCLPLCAMSPSSIMIGRDLFDQVGLFDEALPACEDYDLWLRLTARFPVLFLADPLVVKHGGHADQLSRRYWGIDRFRIRALEKILADPELSDENREAAAAMLAKKAQVYLHGARKRGKWEEVRRYESLLARFQRTEGGGQRTESDD